MGRQEEEQCVQTGVVVVRKGKTFSVADAWALRGMAKMELESKQKAFKIMWREMDFILWVKASDDAIKVSTHLILPTTCKAGALRVMAVYVTCPAWHA